MGKQIKNPKLSYWINLTFDEKVLGDLNDETVLKCWNSLSNLLCVLSNLYKPEVTCTKIQNIFLRVC